jgi:hypothetical protein
LVTGCALGGAFGVVLPVVLFCTAFFVVVGVAFGVEFAEDTWGGFADVVPEDFVMCYLVRWKVSFCDSEEMVSNARMLNASV